MAGGGTVNGDAIISRYQGKLELADKAMKDESWAPQFRRG
jgi:hypothetical protein